jgi:hypothetical protein
MRSRKPWVLARRRLFGWKVRLLTVSLHHVLIVIGSPEVSGAPLASSSQVYGHFLLRQYFESQGPSASERVGSVGSPTNTTCNTRHTKRQRYGFTPNEVKPRPSRPAA